MADKNHRPKASELLQKGKIGLVFGHLTTFEKAFPEIEDVEVEVIERGAGVLDNEPSTHKKPFLGEYINCHNPLCYGGGFSIGHILRDMIFEKKTEFETSKLCKGYEGSPGGRRRYRSCLNNFKIKVRIKYKNQKPEEDYEHRMADKKECPICQSTDVEETGAFHQVAGYERMIGFKCRPHGHSFFVPEHILKT